MRRSILIPALVAWCTACSTPDRDFPSDDEATSSTATSSGSAQPSSSNGGPGSGAGGEGTGGDAGSSSSQGGAPEGCGNGTVEDGEECDETTTLCNDACELDCPEGWAAVEGKCFAIAIADIPDTMTDAFPADASCGALDVGSSAGHRAHAAAPATLVQVDELGFRCPEPGCWLGFYAFGPPGEQVFTAPATGATLIADAPTVEGGLGEDLCLKVVTNDGGGTGSRGVIDAQPCLDIGYVACELDPTYGDFANCNDGIVDEGEECDGDTELCDDCDRRCPEGWVEDPRTHACLQVVDELLTWTEAGSLCVEEGGRLASPDEVADFRVAAALTTDAWIGLEALGIAPPPIPAWTSGEDFVYEPGAYPLPADPTEVSNGFIGDGIAFDLPEATHGALCEQLDPDAD